MWHRSRPAHWLPANGRRIQGKPSELRDCANTRSHQQLASSGNSLNAQSLVRMHVLYSACTAPNLKMGAHYSALTGEVQRWYSEFRQGRRGAEYALEQPDAVRFRWAQCVKATLVAQGRTCSILLDRSKTEATWGVSPSLAGRFSNPLPNHD